VVVCLDRTCSHDCCERSHDPLLVFILAIERHDIQQTLKLGQDGGRFATGLWQLNRGRLEAVRYDARKSFWFAWVVDVG
jgi:hypothetical protein